MPKKPFSGKQKKQQLKDKRAKKREDDSGDDNEEDHNNANESEEVKAPNESLEQNVEKIENVENYDDFTSFDPKEFHKVAKKNKRNQNKGKVADKDSEDNNGSSTSSSHNSSNNNSGSGINIEVNKINAQPNFHGKPSLRSSLYDPNRYNLHFEKESKAEIEKRKAASREVLTKLPETVMEVDIESIHPPGHVIDIPKRPLWDYSLSTSELLQKEETYFKSYLNNIYSQYTTSQLSYFEHNLETWRQLWRVLEISDIILLIADIRHPVLHFPPALYNYVVHDLKKHLIFVLNKIDLVSPIVTEAWIKYFREKFPDLHLAAFSSFPEWGVKDIKDVFRKKKERIGKKKKRAIGVEQILSACAHLSVTKSSGVVDWTQQLHAGGVDLSAAAQANSDIEKEQEEDEEQEQEQEEDDDDEDDDDDQIEELEVTNVGEEERTVHKDFVTIGLVGHPNVGKSSLINALMGKKVVSTSRTPGHTKHFQTIFLTPQVRLCDCPGLVFPSLVPKQTQILASMYPIAQVSEPYSVIKFLAERIDLVALLELKHPDNEKENPQWSAWDICEAWAEKRGYKTAKAARLDVYRAANSLLRLAVDGRIVLSMKPPGFYAEYKNVIDKEPTRSVKFSAHASLKYQSEKAMKADSKYKKGEEEEEKEEDEDEEEEEDEDEDIIFHKAPNTHLSNSFDLLGEED